MCLTDVGQSPWQSCVKTAHSHDACNTSHGGIILIHFGLIVLSYCPTAPNGLLCIHYTPASQHHEVLPWINKLVKIHKCVTQWQTTMIDKAMMSDHKAYCDIRNFLYYQIKHTDTCNVMWLLNDKKQQRLSGKWRHVYLRFDSDGTSQQRSMWGIYTQAMS